MLLSIPKTPAIVSLRDALRVQDLAQMIPLVSPGEQVTNDSGFMRGHGTYLLDGTLISSVSGHVEKVNRLVTARPIKCRYNPEIGDVVVGRITEIGPKRWKVDCNSKQEGVLLLSSIYLPGAIQRRRSEDDELSMRSFFCEGEILVAEVQTLYHDGGFGVHTRSLKYGKLVTGEMLCVQSSLVKRSKSHFLHLPWGVEVILGLNGYVWVGKPRTKPEEQNLDAIFSAKLDDLTTKDRLAICKTRNIISDLNQRGQYIDENAILEAYGRWDQFHA